MVREFVYQALYTKLLLAFVHVFRLMDHTVYMFLTPTLKQLLLLALLNNVSSLSTSWWKEEGER